MADMCLSSEQSPGRKETLPVLIIGAGIAGLALAHGLKKHSIPFALFERDLTRTSRSQGYRVRLGGDSLRGLSYLLEPADLELFELSCGEYAPREAIPQIAAITAQADFAGLANIPKKRSEHSASKAPDARTVDRTVFRDVLLRKLEANGEVRFGKAFSHYSIDETSGLVTAYFEDGTSALGSLLVGADGKRSVLRSKFFPNQEQVDTGGRAIYGKTPVTPELLRGLSPEIMRGLAAVKDHEKDQTLSLIVEPVIFPHRENMLKHGVKLPEDYLYWVLASQPERMGFFSNSRTPHLSPHEAEGLTMKLTEEWHPSLRTIFTHQKRHETALLSIYSVKSDFEAREEGSSRRITLIGDACHVMTPAGSGAITAIRDSFSLCRMIVENHGRISHDLVESFEQDMQSYAGKAVALSWMAVTHIFGRTADAKQNVGHVMAEIKKRRDEKE